MNKSEWRSGGVATQERERERERESGAIYRDKDIKLYIFVSFFFSLFLCQSIQKRCGSSPWE